MRAMEITDREIRNMLKGALNEIKVPDRGQEEVIEMIRVAELIVSVMELFGPVAAETVINLLANTKKEEDENAINI